LLGCRSRVYKQQALLDTASSCSNKNLTTEALFNGAKSGVAVVRADSFEGSAFVIRQTTTSTYLITNSHVVGPSHIVALKWSDGSQDTANVVANSGASTPQADMALLEVQGVRGRALVLNDSVPSVGADIIAIGAPQGLEFSLTRGVLSSLRDNGEILQIDASINPGNSGGPILDKSGCVVGMATFKLDKSEGLNFAISSSLIEAFLRKSIVNSGPIASSSGLSTPSKTTLLSPHSFGPVSPAPTRLQANNCWFQDTPGSQQLIASKCKITSTIASQGRTGIILINSRGDKWVLYLYANKRADIYFGGQRFNGLWSKIQNGYISIHSEAKLFAFQPPE